MRDLLARQHWNFSTAPVLRGPDHLSMRPGSGLFHHTFLRRVSLISMIHGDVGIAPVEVILATAEDLRRHLRGAFRIIGRTDLIGQ